jgi:hypothetical protein
MSSFEVVVTMDLWAVLGWKVTELHDIEVGEVFTVTDARPDKYLVQRADGREVQIPRWMIDEYQDHV